MYFHIVLPCEHEKAGLLRRSYWQEDALKSAAGTFTRVVTTRDTETGSID